LYVKRIVFSYLIIFVFSCLALTNKGNCCFARQDYDKARYYYEEALNIDAGCVEALHNLSMNFCFIEIF
jgi:tetratricopeptide (TPR) repeat protein